MKLDRRAFLLSPLAAIAASTPPLAIANVAVVNGPAVDRDRTLILDGDRIASLADRPPRNARILDGRGRYLIPGLWDMHVHLSVSGPGALPIFLANGVTGVRDMGGRLADLDRWRLETAAAPRVFRAGPILNGRAFNDYQVALETADEARGAVRALHNAGVDFIKVHAAMGRDAYFAIADETRRLKLRFAGHLPRAISAEEAIHAGQSTIEHLDRIADTAALAPNQTFFTPTLVIERASAHVFDRPATPYDRYISARSRAISQELFAKYKELMTPEWSRDQEKQFEANLRLVPRLGRLLAGTDVGSSLLVPGFSLHDELTLLVQAGLKPADALLAATRNPADALGLADAGRIAEGCLADLVLLDANPLDDIRNTRKIRAVVSRGRLYDRAALDALLASPPAA